MTRKRTKRTRKIPHNMVRFANRSEGHSVRHPTPNMTRSMSRGVAHTMTSHMAQSKTLCAAL
eukprot:11196935-Lingulodinium_polyedra.AAC.1